MALSQNSGSDPTTALVLAELNRVLGQALDEVESEQRLDLAYEVTETVRFERSHIAWLDRLRNTSNDVELHVAHPQLPLVIAQLVNVTDPFLVLRNHSHQYFVNSNFVVAACGLNHLVIEVASSDHINWLDNVWFHDLADRRRWLTWYLAGGQTFEGYCLRTGFDAIDIETNTKVLTFPKKLVVAGKLSQLVS